MFKKKIKISEFYFIIYYVVFFVSLFVEDIAFEIDISPVTKVIKAFVAIILVVIALSQTWKKNFFISLLIGIIIGITILAFSGDFFWLVVILMGFMSYNINEKLMFKISFYSMIVLMCSVLFFCAMGILPDVLTYRTDMSREVRHSYGFIHSSILPLIIFYLFTYYLKMKEKVKNEVVILFAIAGFVLFKTCQSRNAFYFLIFLCLVVYMLKSELIQKWTKKIIQILAKIIVTLCMAFSIIPGYLRYRGVFTGFWYIFDNIFTNRTLLASSAIQSYGIHLLNKMDYTSYMNTIVNVDSYKWNGVILDSAYLYILIRYGIMVLAFLWFMFRALYKKEKNNLMNCTIIIFIALINMTDNDILSYGFLPYMLMGIRCMWGKFIRES